MKKYLVNDGFELPNLFGNSLRKGFFHILDNSPYGKRPTLFYSHPQGEIWFGDSESWLRTLQTESVDLIFADPPYNLKKAEWDTFESQEKYIEWSIKWIEVASQVLKKNGSLYICGFSEILADLKHPAMNFFKGCRWIVWHYKNKANLGNDWGRSHESILHLRKSKDFIFNVDSVRTPYGNHTLKYPIHPQAATSQYGKGKNSGKLWSPHPLGAKPRDVLEIPTISNGAAERTEHPTQKPEELLRKIILASSCEGDLVIDPFLGSGTTIVAAEQLKRRWKGCDVSTQYCNWAANRIEKIKEWPIDRWIKYDQENSDRRKSIR
ncbi:MAG TPA: restriction endonuclease subunit M [Candidatus Atribacteria bacterium]|nr:restriction endonuclease subunit M [Candidatus Atribacteria bacterium]